MVFKISILVLLVVLRSGAVHAQDRASVAAGIGTYNRFLADIWQARQVEIVSRALQAFARMEAQEDRILEIHDVHLELENPPALAVRSRCCSAKPRRIAFRFPGEGSWNLSLRATVKRRIPLVGSRHRIKVSIRNLRAEVTLAVERDTPISARLLPDATVEHRYDLDLDSSNLVVAALLKVSENNFGRAFEREIEAALEDLLPDVETLRAIIDLDLDEPQIKAQARRLYLKVVDYLMARNDNDRPDPVEMATLDTPRSNRNELSSLRSQTGWPVEF